MNDEALHFLMAEEDHQQRLFFQRALKEIKVNIVLEFVHDGYQLLSLLGQRADQLPHIVFLDLNLPSKGALEYLADIRRDSQMRDVVVAILAPEGAEQLMQEAFVRGANIYLQRSTDFQGLTRMLSLVISMFWQYYTSGLRKENFILNINQHQYKGSQNKTRLHNGNGC